MDIRTIDGRLVKDAEVKTIASTGKKFLAFSVANNDFVKGEKITTYFSIVSYNEFDINRADKLKKGTALIITGKPNEEITTKDNNCYLNRRIIADRIEYAIIGGNNSENNQQTVNTYRNVAPITPSTPTVEVNNPVVEQPYIPTTEVPKSGQVFSVEGVDDDLPF